MTFGRLLVAALLVAPLVGCGGTALVLIVDAANAASPPSGDDMIFGLILIGSFAFVTVALLVLLIGIPVALLLQRLGVPPGPRDLIFLAVAGAAAWLVRRDARSDAFYDGFEPALIGATVLAWIVAMRLASGGAAPVEQANG